MVMKHFYFGQDIARQISDYGSSFHLSRLLWAQTGEVRVDVAFLGSGDIVGLHPAGLPQLFCVLQGSGWARGLDAIEMPITVGEAVFWTPGEEHGVRTEHGLTALIIQAEQLNPDATLRSVSR